MGARITDLIDRHPGPPNRATGLRAPISAMPFNEEDLAPVTEATLRYLVKISNACVEAAAET
jgi:hypothetical protein